MSREAECEEVAYKSSLILGVMVYVKQTQRWSWGGAVFQPGGQTEQEEGRKRRRRQPSTSSTSRLFGRAGDLRAARGGRAVRSPSP